MTNIYQDEGITYWRTTTTFSKFCYSTCSIRVISLTEVVMFAHALTFLTNLHLSDYGIESKQNTSSNDDLTKVAMEW
jgi:hypothetical protein